MKLKEKFAETILVPLSILGFYIDWDKVEKCEEIADEFAIGFADWLETLPPSRKVSMWSKNGELKGLFTMDNEQLLEIYKKEKGL